EGEEGDRRGHEGLPSEDARAVRATRCKHTRAKRLAQGEKREGPAGGDGPAGPCGLGVALSRARLAHELALTADEGGLVVDPRAPVGDDVAHVRTPDLLDADAGSGAGREVVEPAVGLGTMRRAEAHGR